MVAVHLAQFVCACCGCCAPMGCEPRLLCARPGGHHAVALRLWVLIVARWSFAETHVFCQRFQCCLSSCCIPSRKGVVEARIAMRTQPRDSPGVEGLCVTQFAGCRHLGSPTAVVSMHSPRDLEPLSKGSGAAALS